MATYRPRAIHVRIASGCNLGCTFCERELLAPGPGKAKQPGVIHFVDGREDLNLASDMAPAVWERVKAELFPYTDRVELGGLGEPTLGKLFVKAATDVVGAGKQLFFFSNGHYLGQQRVLDSVGDSPHVSISFDAGTPEVYAAVRRGDFAKAVAGAKAFRLAKPNAKIDSQFTATVDNIADVPNWIKLCAEIGIGRFSAGETCLLTGADHHVTDRINKSIRFAKDLTEKAIEEGRKIAQENGIWFIAALHAPSQLNPNAATDGSDPRGVLRLGDLLLGDTPCLVSTDTFGDAMSFESEPVSTGPITVNREIYVDYDGKVWTCLGRHVIGDVMTDDWAKIVDENPEYQEFLRNWFIGRPIQNKATCLVCPRRK